MGLLKTLAIILFFYYAFKCFARLFAPYLVKKATDSMQRRAEQFQQKETTSVREGETVIDKKPTKSKKLPKRI